MSEDTRSLCAICAWREFCQKKFFMENALHCPDYSKDISLFHEDQRKDSKKSESEDDANSKSS